MGTKRNEFFGDYSSVEIEFTDYDTEYDWKNVEGDTFGIKEKILSYDPETGDYTRMLKFPPGIETSETLVHDFWEEVYILEGSYWNGDEYQEAGMYTCKPPGIKHGPFRTEEGYLLYEIRYYLYTMTEK